MRKNFKKIVRAGAAFIVVAGVAVGSAVPAQAAKLEDPWGHFFSCWALASENPEEHARTCLVNRRIPVINSGVANQTPPQQKPVKPEPDEWDEVEPLD